MCPRERMSTKSILVFRKSCSKQWRHWRHDHRSRRFHSRNRTSNFRIPTSNSSRRKMFRSTFWIRSNFHFRSQILSFSSIQISRSEINHENEKVLTFDVLFWKSFFSNLVIFLQTIQSFFSTTSLLSLLPALANLTQSFCWENTSTF